MPSFTDSMGREWKITFDGITLKELRETHKIDLSDVVGSVYSQLKRDPAALTIAIAFLCADQLKEANLSPKKFAASLIGTVLDDAYAALWGAAEGFFPPSLWSVLSTRCKQESDMQAEWVKMKPILALFNQPEVPSEIRQEVFTMIGKMLPTDLASLEGVSSVSGLENIPPTAATN